MLQVIRLYGSAEDAERAVARLRWEGFTDDLITFKGPSGQERRWAVSVRPPFGMGRVATEALDRFDPVGSSVVDEGGRGDGLELISQLSGSQSPGAISSLSRYKSPGAISTLSRSQSPGGISTLSRRRSPGAISNLSRSKSPGAISRLSQWKSPGAISRLSRTSPNGAVARLSAGWYFSSLFGLPLLSRSAAFEPEDTPAIRAREAKRTGGVR